MPKSTGGGSHSSGSHSSSGSSYRSSSGGSHSSGYSSSSSRSSSSYSSSSRSSYGGSHSSGYRSSSGWNTSSSYGSSSRSSYGSSSSAHSYSSYSSPRPSPAYGTRTKRPTPPPKPDYRYKPFVSQNVFTGATRYVYYRDHKPQYIYSNHETVKRERHYGRLWFWIPFLMLWLAGTITLFSGPLRIDNPGDHASVVADTISVVDNKAELVASLEAFQNLTGIPTVVATVNNHIWQNANQPLDDYVLELYTHLFEDEQHWLIVYSEPQEPDPNFVDWHWEGVQGDETVYALTEGMIEFFNQSLQKKLTASSQYGVGEAFAAAFDDLSAKIIADNTYTINEISVGIALMLIWITVAAWRVGLLAGKPKRPNGMPQDICRAVGDEYSCPGCSGVYLTSQKSCPYCGLQRSI